MMATNLTIHNVTQPNRLTYLKNSLIYTTQNEEAVPLVHIRKLLCAMRYIV
jgi:hypothetical protein